MCLCHRGAIVRAGGSCPRYVGGTGGSEYVGMGRAVRQGRGQERLRGARVQQRWVPEAAVRLNAVCWLDEAQQQWVLERRCLARRIPLSGVR